MRVKVVWQTGVWLNNVKVKHWQEAEVDEPTARMLEEKKMVVIMDPPPAAPKIGRPRKEVSDA